MQEKPKKIFAILLFVSIFALIITNIGLSGRISNLEHSINNIQFNQAQEVRNLQWDLSHRIDLINEQIEQMSRISFDETFNILRYNSVNLSADVEIGFNLKEFGIDDIVSVTARGMNGQIIESGASLSGAGRFTATMTLPVQDNFTLSFNAVGDSVTSGSLIDLHLANMLSDRFRFHSNGSISSSRDANSMWLSPHFATETQGNNALEVRDIALQLISDGDVVEYWDLLPYLRTIGNIQVIDEFTLDYFQINESRLTVEGFNIVRLIIHDNLGIRYEQMEQLPFFHFGSAPTRAGFAWGGGVAFTGSPGDFPSRIISYGEDSWHFVHMVIRQ